MRPDVAELLNAATAALRQGRGRDALALGRKALKRAPDEPAALFVMGVAERTAGSAEKAAKHLKRAAERDRRAPAVHQQLGLVLGQLGRWDDAAAALRQAAELAPRDAALLTQLGVACQQAGLVDEALASYRRAAELAPDNAEIRYNIGTALMRKDEVMEAIAAFEATLALNPEHAAAIRHLGHLQSKVGAFESAAIWHRRALRNQPGELQITFDLAYALAVAGSADEAVALLHQALSAGGASVKLLELLAFCEMRAGRAADCIATCERVLSRHPTSTSALAYKSMALNELGERQAAAFLIDVGRLAMLHRADAPSGFESLAAFNAAFIAALEAHPSLRYSPINRSLTRGRSTGELFEAPDGAIAVFKTMVEAAVEAYRESHPLDPGHPFLSARPEQVRIGCWANIMDGQGFHDVHFHPPGWLSGVYYPDVPAAVADGSAGHQGWIEFGRAYYQFESKDEPPVTLVRPEAGLFVLFPSYFGHRTIPVRSDQRRVSVAFDVMPAD